MPATRSRTHNWRSSLQSIHDRGGALEVSLAGSAEHDNACNLIWRVRILDLSATEIVVEEPMALGKVMTLEPGTEVISIIVIGQNRWMFRTTVIGPTTIRNSAGFETGAVRLVMPEHVERCQRRNFYRVRTEHLTLPPVDCYPLLDVGSAIVAEKANAIELLRAGEELISGTPQADLGEHDVRLPNVGPKIGAVLVNVGGGGAGLKVESTDRGAFDAHRYYWLRIGLGPVIAAPLGVVARLRHTHIDSTQALYAGMSFEFGHNIEHQSFVVEQLSRYVDLMQREQSDAEL